MYRMDRLNDLMYRMMGDEWIDTWTLCKIDSWIDRLKYGDNHYPTIKDN